MVTLVMRPDFTSSRNCEYSIGACAAWRVLNWLNTVISTSPMTSQMTRFLSMLFKRFAPSEEIHLTGRASHVPPRKSPPIHPERQGVLRLLRLETSYSDVRALRRRPRHGTL